MDSPALRFAIAELMDGFKNHNHQPFTDEVLECPICMPKYKRVVWLMDLLKSEWK